MCIFVIKCNKNKKQPFATARKENNMKFRKVQLELIRKELEESDFYEDIMFANDEVKERTQKNVANWIVSLRISETIKGKIKRLKQLFCKVEGINFPIIINESMDNKLDFEIVDKNEKRYYFYKNDVYDYSKVTEYCIGRRKSVDNEYIDYEYCYKIDTNQIIRKIQTTVIKGKFDEKDSDLIYETYYEQEKNIEVIRVLSKEKRKIEIEYPMISKELNKKIFEEFIKFTNNKWYYYDVFPIFLLIFNKLKKHNINTIHITSMIEEEVYSEIKMVNNIMQVYTVTQIVSENEIHIIKKIMAKEINDFLEEKE